MYSIAKPEMRKVGSNDIAVYEVSNINTANNLTEYIPGYFIQKSADSLPSFIQKRYYYSTSYIGRRDALRTVRRKYPTAIIGDSKFDIDDDFNPYQIFLYRENLSHSNGSDYGIIVLNLKDGSSEMYPAAEDNTPSWVDFSSTYPR